MRWSTFLSLFPLLILVQAWDFDVFNQVLRTAQQKLGLATPPLRVAIIGAGAGGASAAFWIQKAKERHGMDVEVHIYDKYDYVGGRSVAVHPYGDRSLPAEELGGAVFVRANKNLFRAAEEFGLKVVDLNQLDNDLGIWDGNRMILTYQGGWWDTLRILWRYGYYSPTKTSAIVKDMIEKLLASYTPKFHLWSTIGELSIATGLIPHARTSAFDFFISQNVSARFINEMIEGATRANYAQDVASIHGLEGAVSMAATGASQVDGGNFQIFEKFVAYSKAKLFLNTTITGLAKSRISGKTRWTLSTSSDVLPAIVYDHIILSTPFHSSGITLSHSSACFPTVEYIRLHVTLLSSTSFRPLAEKFGLKAGSAVPSMLLTTNEGARNGGPAPDFNSISYHHSFERDGKTEYVFKVFSLEEKSDQWLESIFGAGTLGWVHRKEWDSYPRLPPTETYPPIRADDGLWYVNSMEPWISTMETETLASRNIVDNMLREVFGEGICPAQTSLDGWGTTIEDKKVYGWDC